MGRAHCGASAQWIQLLTNPRCVQARFDRQGLAQCRNANGDIEPCAFIHYSDSNIREKTLLEAYQSPLFMEYKKGQPFNENHLRPCPLLDNNGRLAEMVHASGAHSTDLATPEDVDSLCAKCAHACENWEPVAKQLWEERNNHSVSVSQIADESLPA